MLEHRACSVEQISARILERLAPSVLVAARSVDVKHEQIKLEAQRRAQAKELIYGVVSQVVHQAWAGAMSDARATMRPSLLAWVIQPERSQALSKAAGTLPRDPPQELLGKLYRHVLAKPEIQAYVEQCARGAAASSCPEAVVEAGGTVAAQVGRAVEDTQTKAVLMAQAQADRAAQAASDAVHKRAYELAEEAERVARQQAEEEAGKVARDHAYRQAEEESRRAAERETERAVAAAAAEASERARHTIEDTVRAETERELARLERTFADFRALEEAELQTRVDNLKRASDARAEADLEARLQRLRQPGHPSGDGGAQYLEKEALGHGDGYR
jgi:hypothetical protein